MQQISDNQYTIFFGDKQHAFDKSLVDTASLTTPTLTDIEPFKTVAITSRAEFLIFTKQVHGVASLKINQKQTTLPHSFNITADYIITNQPNIGIGIATADCLPIILFDPIKCVSAAIHAGWRGSTKGIAQMAVNALQHVYGTSPDTIIAFFGPCIKKCCYSVGQELLINANNAPFSTISSFQKQTQLLYFDLVEYNMQYLHQAGILRTAIKLDYNHCTACNQNFCSYRRDNQSPLRQISSITIHTT